MSKKTPSSAVLPWKTRIKLFIASTFADVACRLNGTINCHLLKFFEIKVRPNANSVNNVKTVNITVDPNRNLWFLLFSPTESPQHISWPVIVFFHDGGFSFLSPEAHSYDAVCCRMAWEIPAVIVSINYRLLLENCLPSQYEDGFDTLKFLDQGNCDDLPSNAKLSWCFLVGDNVGANLSHHIACRAGGSDLHEVKVIGLILIQPFFGGKERTESEIRLVKASLVSLKRTDWMWKVFLPEGANRDHEAVNVSGRNSADISGVKYLATVVFMWGLDPLQDMQRGYYEWLKRFGKDAYLIEYPNTVHAFYVFAELSESSLFINKVRNFI